MNRWNSITIYNVYTLIFFLGALRCCRRIVGLKDEFYNRYIVKGKLFDAIVESFKCNENRYNLLNSATVELFEFIRQVRIWSEDNVCTKRTR